MTLGDLLAQLEGCHTGAELRLATLGVMPLEHAFVGVTSTRLIGRLHVAGTAEPGVVWLLGSPGLGPLTSLAWHPRNRHIP